MKKTFCALFNHPTIKDFKREEKDSSGFRFYLSCACGEREIKSIVLTDNDLLSDLELHSHSFPVDEAVRKQTR